MKLLNLSRRCIQICAFAIFAYQMIEAFKKFTSFNSVVSVSYKDIAETTPPSIYICLKEQEIFTPVQYASLVRNGFASFQDFLHGQDKNESNSFTWEGWQNRTYENMTKQLFARIGADDVSIFRDATDLQSYSNISEQFTIFNGFCKRFNLNTSVPRSQQVFVNILVRPAHKELRILLADPESSLYHMINIDALKGDDIITEKATKKVYLIDLEEHYLKEESGECTEYGENKEFSSYADCVATEHDSLFSDALRCSVPWLWAPNYPASCQGRVSLTRESLEPLLTAMQLIYDKIRFGKLLDQSHSCLKPCHDISATATARSQDKIKGFFVMRQLRLVFNRSVKLTHYNKEYGYSLHIL